jgi:hypothetical protein
MKANMKLMMDLLVRLQEFEAPVHDACRARQFSPLEERAARAELDLVRDILPAEVLGRYDEMKSTDEELWENPELFAMAVISDTYRSLSPGKRKKFLGHFGGEPRLCSSAHRPGRRNGNGEHHSSLRRLN